MRRFFRIVDHVVTAIGTTIFIAFCLWIGYLNITDNPVRTLIILSVDGAIIVFAIVMTEVILRFFARRTSQDTPKE